MRISLRFQPTNVLVLIGLALVLVCHFLSCECVAQSCLLYTSPSPRDRG